jgi:SAM-dependent methyltransferase
MHLSWRRTGTLRAVSAPTPPSIYREYAINRRPAPLADPLIFFFHRRMLEHAALAPGRILEIGFGHGYFAQVARARACEYIGVDMSQQISEAARRNGFEVVTAFVPPIPTQLLGRFDHIWLSHVLEHARDWLHAREMVQACYDALPRGGTLCVIAPDLISYGAHFWDGDWNHGYPTTLNRVTQLLRDVGFEVRASHHTLTITQPLVRTLLDFVMALMPVRFLDAVTSLIAGKRYCSSFMSLMGWRQILCIAVKR